MEEMSMKTLSERLRGPIKHPQQLTSQRIEAADAIDVLVMALERGISHLEDEGFTDEFAIMQHLKAVLAKHKRGTKK
jgi:hypothetical protein